MIYDNSLYLIQEPIRALENVLQRYQCTYDICLLHDLRVLLRRLRFVSIALKKNRLTSILKDFAYNASFLRDFDVFMHALDGEYEIFEAHKQQLITQWNEYFTQHVSLLYCALGRLESYTIASHSEHKLFQQLSSTLARLTYQSFNKMNSPLDTINDFHTLRKKLKFVRYGADIVAIGNMQLLSIICRELQGVLGDLNDRYVWIEILSHVNPSDKHIQQWRDEIVHLEHMVHPLLSKHFSHIQQELYHILFDSLIV